MKALIVDGLVSKYPYTIADLKADHPNVSFPSPLPTERLEERGIIDVAIGDEPAYTPATQRLALSEVPVKVAGVWTVEYSVVAKSADEIEADTLTALTRSEGESVKLFFRLCKTLIDNGSVNANDPNMAEIKIAFQEWKTLKGL